MAVTLYGPRICCKKGQESAYKAVMSLFKMKGKGLHINVFILHMKMLLVVTLMLGGK